FDTQLAGSGLRAATWMPGTPLKSCVGGGISRATKRKWSRMRAARASGERPRATRSGVSANTTGAKPSSNSRSSGGAVRLMISLISESRLSLACGSDVIMTGIPMILLESRGVKFRVQYPNASGHEVELEGTVAILGRDPSCDLVLNDVKCSRRHAVVEAGPQGLAIRDTGSANGIFLNGKKVDRSPLSQ